jgi:hypothetical protein
MLCPPPTAGLCHEETFASAGPHSTPRSCLGLRTREIAISASVDAAPAAVKTAPKLTGYACRSLDDQRRSQEFTH